MTELKKLIRIFPLAALAVGVVAFVPFASAQDDDDEDVYELSPFQVEADEEGYFATETLAGTRLRTDVRDLAASISVVTEELMNDLATEDLETLLPYLANTESGGLFGNFSGEGTVSFFGQGVPSTFVRMNPQAQTRVRGLSAADLTRNYNLSNVPLDSYNVERVAVQRGANAMLFGLGSPSGLVNYQLTSAGFEDATRVQYRTDEYGTNRFVVDVNQELVDDKLAVRVSGLREDKEFNQEPTFEEDRRVYGTVTYRPFKGTTFRARHEDGEIRSSRPDPISPVNHMSEGWFDAGMPLATPEIYATGNVSWPFGNMGAFAGGGNVFTTWEPNGAINANVPNAATGGLAIDGGNSPGKIDGTNPNVMAWRFLSSGTYTGNFGTPTDPTAPPSADSRGEEQGFLDFDIANWEDIKYFAAELGLEDFNSTQFTFEQLFFQENPIVHAGVEFTFMQEDYDIQFFDPQWDGISGTIAVDVNPILADGSPNPNVGRPYTANINPREQVRMFEEESQRVSAFLDLDFTKTDDMRWLGRHTLTAVFNEQESFDFQWESPWNAAPSTNDQDLVAAFAREVGAHGFGSQASLRYLGPSVLGVSNYRDITIPFASSTQLPIVGEELDYQVFDEQSQTFLTIPAQIGGPGRPRKAGGGRNENDSVATILHSHFFEGMIVTTLGWREDDVDLFKYDSVFDEASLIDVATINPPRLSFADNFSDDIFSFGIVAHWPEQWVELPAGMDLSFHYSDSENFDPTPGRLDVAGNPIPTPSGSTEEVGFRASFLDRKINVKVNWYETALTNAEASTPIGNPEAIGENRILNQVGDYLNTAERQFDLGNVALSDELVATAETILAIAPQSILEAESFERRGRFDVDFTDPGNQSFLADRVSDGVEIEVFGSPMEGLTMGFNASRQEVVQSNVAPRALALIEELTPKWRAIGDIPANAVDFVAAAQGNPNPNARTFNDLTDEIISLAEQTRNQEGFPLAEIREWRWNAFATYDFSGNSWWSDVTLGGALRWQDEGVIGHNSTTFTGPDGQTLFTADLSSPITVDSLLQGDLWISYDVPLLAERGVDWNIQLNIRNLLRDEDTIGVRAQPDRPEVGFIAQSRLTQPTTFVLTSTWDF